MIVGLQAGCSMPQYAQPISTSTQIVIWQQRSGVSLGLAQLMQASSRHGLQTAAPANSSHVACQQLKVQHAGKLPLASYTLRGLQQQPAAFGCHCVTLCAR
eukprot:GHUV01023360.1.p2 GENE.GHUV01023360.1~~GHUV01023360.1.p2  ORF type:complete len:101 (+),score=30.97 GHUV01023360.1:519-821(+)